MVNSPQPTNCARQNPGKPSHQPRTEPADLTGELADKIGVAPAFDFTQEQRPFGQRRQAQPGCKPLFSALFTDFSAAFTEWRFPPCGNGRKDVSPQSNGVRRGAAMASINYAVGDNWGSGFIGNMTVPGGELGLHGWIIE